MRCHFRAFFDGLLSGIPREPATVSCGPGRDFAWYRADFTTIFTSRATPQNRGVAHDITTAAKGLAYQKWKQTYADMPADGMNYYEYFLSAAC